MERGRVLSDFPKHWIRHANKAVSDSDLQDKEKKSKKIQIGKIVENALLRRRPGNNYDIQKDWLENAKNENKKINFQAIISSSVTKENWCSNLLPIDFAPDNPLWKNELAPIDFTAEGISEEIRPLLEISQDIIFVDKNFYPYQPAFINVLNKVIEILSTNTRLRSFSYNISLKIDQTKQEKKNFIESIEKSELTSPNGLNIDFYEHPPNEEHDRYLITDIGAVKIGEGWKEVMQKNRDKNSIERLHTPTWEYLRQLHRQKEKPFYTFKSV
jgi:hypothetical protein